MKTETMSLEELLEAILSSNVKKLQEWKQNCNKVAVVSSVSKDELILEIERRNAWSKFLCKAVSRELQVGIVKDREQFLLFDWDLQLNGFRKRYFTSLEKAVLGKIDLFETIWGPISFPLPAKPDGEEYLICPPGKEKGCPNCQSETVSSVFVRNDFGKYEALRYRGLLGKNMCLFECSLCNNRFIQMIGGHLIHRMLGESNYLLNSFFAKSNEISDPSYDLLQKVAGSEFVNREFPVSVTDKLGQYYPHAIIKLCSELWPISIVPDFRFRNLKFYSEIKEFSMSPEAMTQEQRKRAEATGEGPEWPNFVTLTDGTQKYNVDWRHYFIPHAIGTPQSFRCEKDMDWSAPILKRIPVVTFWAHLAVRNENATKNTEHWMSARGKL